MNYHPEDQLSAYMDDELNEDERQQVEAHLEKCESCQVLLEELLSIQSDVLHTFTLIQEPADFEMRVLGSIATKETPAVAGKGWLFIPATAFLALVVFWVLAGTVFVNMMHGFLKIMIAMIYMTSHFISSVPVLSGLTVVLSLIILTTSVYSLRRLLQTTTS
ncbi:zf-HC2 domain-containing protein [Paenibacillus sp. BR2-3]|uniref:anti-sigma factor family protein n=1 Tax=Paenibacillus sp. BR2-3 TaxID=3048494 RepID=UPI0039776269